MSKFKKGFTLAEVLITLGIIGVVAALTIPTLMANQAKTQYVTGLKKAYSVLNQAFTKYEVDNGCVGDLQCTGLFSDTIPNNIAKWDDFANNYLQTVKNCGISTTDSCFPSSYKYLNKSGTASVTNDGTLYSIILKDGTSVLFKREHNCDNWTTLPNSNELYGQCGIIMVDVTGFKGPNVRGRDWFNMFISRYHGAVGYNGSQACDKAISTGDGSYYWKTTTDDMYNCSTSDTSEGRGCNARILDEGWQMNY